MACHGFECNCSSPKFTVTRAIRIHPQGYFFPLRHSLVSHSTCFAFHMPPFCRNTSGSHLNIVGLENSSSGHSTACQSIRTPHHTMSTPHHTWFSVTSSSPWLSTVTKWARIPWMSSRLKPSLSPLRNPSSHKHPSKPLPLSKTYTTSTQKKHCQSKDRDHSRNQKQWRTRCAI
jgi:hypothetical protein